MSIVPYAQWCPVTPNGTPGRMPLPAPRVWLHHGAAGTSTIDTAISYARYHVAKGWQAVGYPFLIADGQVLEGRGAGRIGAHTRGDNDQSHGICMVGDYTTVRPSAADLDALRWLLRHGTDKGWWPSPTLTGGHRDAPGASTSCPGAALYRLIPTINKPDEPEDDMTPTQEAKLDALASDVAEIKSRIPDNLAEELDMLRRGMRAQLTPDVTDGP